jgi:hypothetical protein
MDLIWPNTMSIEVPNAFNCQNNSMNLLPFSGLYYFCRTENKKLHTPWKTFPLISTSYDSMTSWIAAPTSQSRASIPAS